jgi:hypothetical protein
MLWIRCRVIYEENEKMCENLTMDEKQVLFFMTLNTIPSKNFFYNVGLFPFYQVRWLEFF